MTVSTEGNGSPASSGYDLETGYSPIGTAEGGIKSQRNLPDIHPEGLTAEDVLWLMGEGALKMSGGRIE